VGSLQLLQSEHQVQVARAYFAASGAAGPAASFLTAAEAARLEPSLSHAAAAGSVLGAVHFEADALLEPRTMFPSWIAWLARTFGDRFRYRPTTTVSRLDADGAGAVRLTTAGGEAHYAGAVALCTGADVTSLVPGLFASELSKLRLCKLQMMRLGLPQGLRISVTSGLSMRRYPAFIAAAPHAHAAMMAAESPDPEAEALGVHIIARPAGALTRTAFGSIDRAAPSSPASMGLSPHEVIVGDSHQYARLDCANELDEACDERVTDVILRVAGSMLNGVEGVRTLRSGGSSVGGASSQPAARVLSQWTGVYLQHDDGVLNRSVALEAAPGREGWAAQRGGSVHVVTGIGGKGMTMSPALAEENVARWFPTA
jgi:hypothetical protein